MYSISERFLRRQYIKVFFTICIVYTSNSKLRCVECKEYVNINDLKVPRAASNRKYIDVNNLRATRSTSYRGCIDINGLDGKLNSHQVEAVQIR